MSVLLRLGLAGAAVAAAVGCMLLIAEETLYLQSAEGRATQEEVRQRLGVPRLVATTKAGESVWVYEVYAIEPGGQNTWMTTGSWCDEYVLTFDGRGILRAWTHKSEKHGGERMPTYCVTNGFRPES
ncbi:hypothetical protein [Nitrospira sp. Kam-Ns4a]